MQSLVKKELVVSMDMYGVAWAASRLAYESLFYACALMKNPENVHKFSNDHMEKIDKQLPRVIEGVFGKKNDVNYPALKGGACESKLG